MRDQTFAGLRTGWSTDWIALRKARELVRGWKPLRWGLVIALAAVTMGVLWQSQWPGDADAEEEVAESTAVLVADRYIPALSVVRPAMVKPKLIPRRWVPPGALHSMKELESTQGAGLFSAAVAIPEGQPLTRTVVADLSRHHGMASYLSPGQVAVSFSVDPVRGAGGWIQPGDVVAIFTAENFSEDRPGRAASQLLFSSVHVLAVDQKRVGLAADASADSTATNSGETVLTVGMNPIEAARLVEAREKGHLSVLLRALGDDAPWAESRG